MSKPLDLAVFEPSRCSCPCREPFWIDPRDGSQRPRHHFNADPLIERIDYDPAKRLTDPELAAEYWRLRLKVCSRGNRDMKAKGHVCCEWQAAHDELDTMQRFMELPHYDEVDA